MLREAVVLAVADVQPRMAVSAVALGGALVAGAQQWLGVVRFGVLHLIQAGRSACCVPVNYKQTKKEGTQLVVHMHCFTGCNPVPGYACLSALGCAATHAWLAAYIGPLCSGQLLDPRR